MYSEMEVVVMEELKPCPFCGNKAEAYSIIDGSFACSCTSCSYASCAGFNTEQEAIEAWNTRAEHTCTFETVVFEDGAFTHNVLECSNCGLHIEPEISGRVPSFVNYCPHCGARTIV